MVVGLGAIGSVLAVKLSSKYELLAVDRKARIDQIASKGLKISGLVNKTIFLKLAEQIPVIKQPTIIFVCTKAYDLEEVVRNIVCPDPSKLIIVCVQNGIGVEEIVKSIHPQCRVIRVVTFLAAEMTSLNKVKFVGDNSTCIDKADDDLVEIFSQAGLKSESVDDIEVKIWEKLIYNCVINGLGAVLEVKNSDLNADTLSIIKQMIVRECVQVAKAENIRINEEILNEINKFIKNSRNYNSTLVDLRKGKRTEIDYLSGAVVRLGKLHGISTPANQVITDLVKFKGVNLEEAQT